MIFPCYLLLALLVLSLCSCIIGVFKEDVNDPMEDKVSKAPKLADNDDFR